MHEYSIVQSLLNSCEEHTQKNGATKVKKITLKIGVLSGVEPELLQTAFDTFKENTVAHESEMIINIQPLVIRCNDCQKQMQIDDFEFKCQGCGSLSVSAIDGEEMYLMSLELE